MWQGVYGFRGHLRPMASVTIGVAPLESEDWDAKKVGVPMLHSELVVWDQALADKIIDESYGPTLLDPSKVLVAKHAEPELVLDDVASHTCRCLFQQAQKSSRSLGISVDRWSNRE